MSRIPYALQLYSVREDCARDLAGVLKEVAQMGYQGVEFAGFYDHRARDVRGMLDDNGLACAGSHTPLAHLQGDALDGTVALNKEIGNRFLIVPGMPEEYRQSLDTWKRAADVFNGIAERLAPVGMSVGAHNHTAELTPLDGVLPWDAFFAQARNDVVMQMDTGNARAAGADATDLLTRYPGQAATVHLKEWTDDPKGALIGEGKIDWPKVFDLCESVGGTQWYIVEQEQYPYPPMVCARKCLDNIRNMGRE